MKYIFLALTLYLAFLEIKSALTKADRKAFLKQQNAIRSKVAKGKIFNNGSGSNLPKASNMRKLVWSKKLEKKAAKYVKGCMFIQNAGLALYVGEGAADTASLLKNATPAWIEAFAEFGTQKNLRYSSNYFATREDVPEPDDNSDDDDDNSGNKTDTSISYDRFYAMAFVQSIWAKSSKVGCASAVCSSGNDTTSPLVCFYRAPGLLELQPIYKKGKPGKKCPKGTKKTKKSGLCKGKGKKGKPIQK